MRLRAGSHLIVPGARHELLMEQDRFRGQILRGVRRLRAGHAAFRLMSWRASPQAPEPCRMNAALISDP